MSRSSQSKPSAATPSTAKAKKKRFQVSVGDLVTFHSPMRGVSGNVGEVRVVLDRDRVVVRERGALDEDYGGLEWVLRTYKPTGRNATTGSDRWAYSFFITKVIVRVTPKPAKPSKPRRRVVPTRVIETQQQLLDHLSSGSDERVRLNLGAPTDGSSTP